MTRRPTTTEQGYGAAWQRLRLIILARDGYVCAYCGGHANSVDHVVPKADGGSDSPGNLVAACGKCNSARSLQWNLQRRRSFFRRSNTPATSPAELDHKRPGRGPVGVLAVRMGGDAWDCPASG